MNFRAFNNYMNAVENAIDSQHNYHDEKAETTFNQNGRWALNTLERIFNDKEFKLTISFSDTPTCSNLKQTIIDLLTSAYEQKVLEI